MEHERLGKHGVSAEKVITAEATIAFVRLRRAGYAGLGATAAVVALLVFFNAPTVSYSASFNIPDNIFGRPNQMCSPILRGGQTGTVQTFTVNATLEKEFNACLAKNAYPPATINGSAPLSYAVLGFGAPPYPQYALAVQGEESLLVFFEGSRAAYVEGPFEAVTLNPSGIVSVENATIIQGSSATVNFTATIKNVGNAWVGNIRVYFDYPGFGTNSTKDGLTWHSSAFANYLPSCALSGIEPGASCRVSYLGASNPTLESGRAYTLRCIVTGFTSAPLQAESVTSTTATTAGPSTNSTSGSTTFTESPSSPGGFVVVSATEVVYPGSGPNAEWVREFIAAVNAQRGGTPLTEDTALDSFAQTRFNTAITNYTISDYGFDSQSAAYFGGTGRISTEEILYPSYLSPAAFATYIQQYAPGHWNALVNTGYTKFGFYLGNGPAVGIAIGCPVTEITARNVNITQIAIENNCKYQVEDVTYLLIVLSS